MILKAFRIKNYRSIVDTDWCDLSPDNITALIGQNEAGKTTVIEALSSFYDSKITEDILRSDESLPAVSCSFKIEEEEINAIYKDSRLANGLLEKLKELGRINLTRIWDSISSSTVQLEDPSVLEIFNKQELEDEKEEHILDEFLASILRNYKELEAEIATTEQEKADADRKVKEAENSLVQAQTAVTQSPTDEIQKIAKEEALTFANKNLAGARRIQDVKSEELADYLQKKGGLQGKYDLATQEESIKKRIEAERETIRADEQTIRELSKKTIETTDDGLKKKLGIEITETQKRIGGAKTALEQLKVDFKTIRAIAKKVLAGLNADVAREEMKQQTSALNNYVSKEEFAARIIEHIPLFELFVSYSSLLPYKIDLEDVKNNNTSIQGIIGVLNFLKVAEIDADFFEESNFRIREQKIANTNRQITNEFQEFWRQKVGKKSEIKIEVSLENYGASDPQKAGKPYLVFWLMEGQERLHPIQRSAGVRWFLSFYLQLKAAAKTAGERKRLLLIDEPGQNLHIRAQEDVLKVFEDIKDKIQIIYTAHLPHLIELDKIYRILAVQRAEEDEQKSPTVVFDVHRLGSATTDTLSPLYALMGARFSDQQFIKQKNNILLEEISAFYYFSAFCRLLNCNVNWSFLPATGNSNVPRLAYLLLGWGLEFIVVLDDDKSGSGIYNKLKRTLCGDDDEQAKNKLLKIAGKKGIEDLFTQSDFKKFILQDESVLIEGTNSDYCRKNNLKKAVLALKFMLQVNANTIAYERLEEQSRRDIKEIIDKIAELLD